MKKTIDWYLKHKSWWEEIISGEYQKYYERMYGEASTHTTYSAGNLQSAQEGDLQSIREAQA